MVAVLVIAAAAGGLGCDRLADLVSPAAGTPAPDLFADASSVPTRLEEKVGAPVRLLELVLRADSARAQVQNPHKKLNIDEVELRDGVVHDAGPITFVDTQPSEEDLAQATFAMGAVDFARVPEMVRDAPLQLGMDGGKVTHMVLRRILPHEKEVRWRVHVTSSRREGSVEYDASGIKKRVWQ